MTLYKIQPWAHQLECIRRALPRDDYALFLEMGTGKSLTAANILRQWYMQTDALVPTLILCPPIVVENWRRELMANTDVPLDRIVQLVGTGKQRLAKLLAAKPQSILITNYETLLMPEVFAALMQFLAGGFLILDESHKCKEIKSKRTKRAITLSDVTKKRLILTGTPVLNSPSDLFSQYRILDRGKTFGTNFFVFRATYFTDKNAGMPKSKYFPDWRLRTGAVEEIGRLIGPSSMSIKKEECLDLPPLVRKTIYVELSPVQRRLYDEMKKDLITYLGDQACVANLAIVKALRLQQIVSGYLPVVGEGGASEAKRIKDNPRAEALGELLREIAPHHKVIVWSVFKHNYETIKYICEMEKLDYVELHGEIASAQKIRNVDSFNTDPRLRVLVAHPGCGIGVNLCSSDCSIWYSRNFSLADDVQANARNHRSGSEIHTKITRYDLVTPNTIDELALTAVTSKQDVSIRLLKSSQGLI